jgi:ATP-dependent helicase HrpB
MAQGCALLAERYQPPPRAASTTSDLLSAIDNWSSMPPNVQRAADAIADFGMRFAASEDEPASAIPTPQTAIRKPKSAMLSEAAFRRAILAGYPDRVAQRREPGSQHVLLGSGTGATIARESGVRNGEFLVALDVHQSAFRVPHSALRTPQSAMPLIRMASRIEREWLQPNASEVVHRFDRQSGRVHAFTVDRYDALVLAERPAPVDPEIAARVLADAWLARGPSDRDAQLLRRLKFAGHAVDVVTAIRAAAHGARSLEELKIAAALPPDVMRDVDRHAPESIAVPSGRRARLDYQEDGTVSASVKLQELFGLADTPRVGRQREPVLLSLLAPSGRPVQLTRDLRSFWNRTYPDVRKELRGRYPKHPWPEDPWKASPSARPKNRRTRN